MEQCAQLQRHRDDRNDTTDTMGSIQTNFLNASSDFVTGMGSAVGLAGNFYGFNYSKSPQEADIRAMRADWAMVGQDIADVMKKAESHPECLTQAK